MLDTAMAERDVDKELYAWYRDLRWYGTVPLRIWSGLRAHHRLCHP